jgi:hypothetical protein
MTSPLTLVLLSTGAHTGKRLEFDGVRSLALAGDTVALGTCHVTHLPHLAGSSHQPWLGEAPRPLAAILVSHILQALTRAVLTLGPRDALLARVTREAPETAMA